MGRRERNLMRDTNERLKEIEQDLRAMQKQWIEMYETVIRLMNEGLATDYKKDHEHDND